MKRISLIGSTGSIGTSTLKIVENHPEAFQIETLVTYKNSETLIAQAKLFRPKAVGIVQGDEKVLKQALPGIDVRVGEEGILSLIADYPADRLVNAFTGTYGLKPTIAAVRKGMSIALANKESVVSGGNWLMEEVKKYGAEIIPVDSEHSALFQCLQAGKFSEVRRMILTASGGPFLHKELSELQHVTPIEALAHPNWRMGNKVTLDCSNLMNKGLEMIEAHYLFGIPPEKIEVVIHPQSVIHSMVEYVDHSIIAQMGYPDMTTPIQYALSYPDRIFGIKQPFDFYNSVKLSFYLPDLVKFRPLKLAYDALKAGPSYPPFLNKADEVLAEKFLRGEISWLMIGEGLERAIDRHQPTKIDSFDTILQIEEEAVREVEKLFSAIEV
jgi:1-deoxy-D-xylulose-5-phosphate reductoisomerase